MTFDAVVSFIVYAVAYLGGTGAVLYSLFRFFGTKWLDAKFAERLEAFRNEKARELERLKLDINSIFSRVAKLHEREFEVLPKLWEKLNEADIALTSCVMKFSEFPDLDLLSDAELVEFLSGTKLSNYEKDRIRQASNKVQVYRQMIAWHDIHDARNRFADFQSYLRLNRVFIRRELTKKLDALAKMMWKQWVNIHMDQQKPGSGLAGHLEYDKESKPVIAEVEQLVHARLYPTHADDLETKTSAVGGPSAASSYSEA
jgi:hypothetical protein